MDIHMPFAALVGWPDCRPFTSSSIKLPTYPPRVKYTCNPRSLVWLKYVLKAAASFFALYRCVLGIGEKNLANGSSGCALAKCDWGDNDAFSATRPRKQLNMGLRAYVETQPRALLGHHIEGQLRRGNELRFCRATARSPVSNIQFTFRLPQS